MAGKETELINDMTTGSITGQIVRFTIPVFIGNLLQQIYTIADAIIVGQCIGVEGLAAIGATDWIYWLFLWTAVGFCQGFAIHIAIAFGKKDEAELRDSINASVTLSLVTGIAMTVLGVSLARPMLRLLQTPENIVHDSAVFVTILYSGMIIVMLYNMSANILRALGDGKTPFIALAISSAVNIGLDLLTVGALGMGVKGAAASTVIAQAVSVVYSYARIRKIPLIEGKDLKPRMHNPMLRLSWKKGFVMGLQMVLIAAGGVIVQYVVNGLGFLYVAGYTAGGKLLGLIESLAMSLGQSITTFIGQNYGAGSRERMKRGMRTAAVMSLICYVVTGLIIWALARPLLSLFISAKADEAEDVMRIAYRYLLMLILFMIFLYMIHIYRQALVGCGRTILAMLSGFMETITRIGVSAGLVQFVSIDYLYFIEPITWAGAGLFALVSWMVVFRRMHFPKRDF